MPMKNPERAIATLVGQTHALFMAVQAMAKTDPNPQALLAELNVVDQLGLSALEPHPIPDATIGAYRQTLSGIRGAMAAR